MIKTPSDPGIPDVYTIHSGDTICILHYTALRYRVLHSTALHYTAEHFTALQYNVLNCTAHIKIY